jgi:glycosyltransferase involved in cell wall biosynthesis
MADAARVLIVTDEMEVGGSQQQIVYLLRGLDRARWNAELAYFRNRSFLVNRIEQAGIATHHVAKKARIDPVFARNLASLLRKGRYDVVHCFSLTAELWVRVLLPLVPDTRFIASVRGLSLGYPRWQWWFKGRILHRADAVIANARAGARVAAARCGLDESRIRVIPNGVEALSPLPAAERDAERRRLELPEDRACALFVGRLVVEKNVPLLLEALARLPTAQRPFLLLAGEGPLGESLKARAATLGIDRDVRFLGERNDVRHLIRCSDFLVLPSREEGLSNVVLEAMAVGCPPLASAVGGTPEIVEDSVTGILFPSDDIAALVDALARISRDESLRSRLGEAARRTVHEKYTLDRFVTGTEAVYRSVLGSRRGSS